MPLLGHHLEAQRDQRVTGQDRHGHSEACPHGRPVPALAVAVHDVVVDQRRVVQQLDGDGRVHRLAAGGFGAQQREGRAYQLAADASGRGSVRVAQAGLVSADPAEFAVEPADPVVQHG
jgi:hypothetical protein